MRYTDYGMTEEEVEFVTNKSFEYEFVNDVDLITDLYACLAEGMAEVLLTRQDVLCKYRTMGDWKRVYGFVSSIFFKYIATSYNQYEGLDRLLSYMRFIDPYAKEDSSGGGGKSLINQINNFMKIAQMFGANQPVEEAQENAEDAASFMGKGAGNGDASSNDGMVPMLLAGIDPTPGTFSGQYPARIDAIRRFIAGLSAKDWQKLHIVDNFEDLIEEAGHTKKRDISNLPEDNIDIHKVKSMEDIGKVTKSDMARFDSTEDLVVAVNRRDVDKIQDEKIIQKKQLLYFLIDNSGSMSMSSIMVKTDTHESSASNGTIASCVAFAFIKKIKQEKGMFYLRFFDEIPHNLIIAENPEDFRHVSRLLGIANYDGGGTNIVRALNTAYSDIEKAEENTPLEKASVCLISDGESVCSELFDDMWKARFKKYGLHVAMVGRNSNKDLEKCASTYRVIKSLKSKDMENVISDFSK